MKMPVRVYTLDQHQVPDSSEVVEDTIPVFDRLATILIDSGATHFFVNPNLMYGIDVKVERLPYNLEVRAPTGDQYLLTNDVHRNCEIWVGERKLIVDFISLTIKGYDLIIRMNWWVRYHTRLDCRTKMIEFCIPGETTLKLDVRDTLISSALISKIHVRKLFE